MPNWGEIRTSVGKAASSTVRATEEIAGTATMHLKLARLMSKRDDLFEKLGKLTYKQLKTDESHAEEIAAIISQIDTLGVQIIAQKAKIESAKAEKEAAKLARMEERREEKEAREQAAANQEQSCVNNAKSIIEENLKD